MTRKSEQNTIAEGKDRSPLVKAIVGGMLPSVAEIRLPSFNEGLTDNHRSFSNFAPLPSNVEGVEAAMLFSTGLVSFAAIVGPSGWGKSHLLESAANRLCAHVRSCAFATAQEYLSQPLRFETVRFLILDEVQDVLGRSRGRQNLRVMLEHRFRTAKATLLAFTGPGVGREIRAFLPTQREWRISEIRTPAPEERRLLIQHLGIMNQLQLSDELIDILAFHLNGNGHTVSGALNKLRLSGSAWQSPLEIMRACGSLNPYFADNGRWDLKERILKTALSQKNRYCEVSTDDLALYTMLCIAGLCEADVARAMGIGHAEAYGRAAKFGRLISDIPRIATITQEFVEIVISSLVRE